MERGDRSCKVALTPSTAVLDPGMPPDLAVDAQFLYGAPVRWESACSSGFRPCVQDTADRCAARRYYLPGEGLCGMGGRLLRRVSMVRPLATGGPHDPVRAVGLAWIALAPHKLSVAISAPDKVAPRQRVRVAVQVVGSPSAGENPLVTVAAVDEAYCSSRTS